MASIVAIGALVLGVLAPTAASASSTPVTSAVATSAATVAGPVKATLAGFSAGNIISDAVFTDKSTMTEAQIQSFFNSKVTTCRGGYDKWGPIVCLKDFRIDSVTRAADAYCDGYTGATGESAARIIYRVSQSCDINPRVLIVMLQKEQGLVTHTWPSAWRYDKALGQGCPDDAACNPAYVGFFHQIYGAARQMQIYMEGRYFTWYAPGKTWNILYNPDRACGTAPVYVANKATSALYYYTPYQPNAAALRAGYGYGDACSSYGNRNFYNYFTDWFGSTQYKVPTAPSAVKATAGDAKATVTWTAPSSNGGSKITKYTVTAAPGGKTATTTGATSVAVTGLTNGTAYTFTVTATNLAGTSPASAKSAAVTPIAPPPPVVRHGGADRYEAAVALSKASFPDPGVAVVYVANGHAYADATAGAAAAARAGGPLLLTASTSLPGSVATELDRLNPQRVVVLGGPSSVSLAVEEQIRRYSSNVSRQGGANRFEAAVAVSRASFPASGVPVVYISNGWTYADAAAAAAAAGHAGGPVLFTEAGSLPNVVKSELMRLRPTRVVIVGGTPSVSATVERQILGYSANVTRQGGADRFTAAATASKAAYPSGGVPVVYLANGSAYADAAAGATAAGYFGGPLLFTGAKSLPASVATELERLDPQRIVILGGTPSISDTIEAQVAKFTAG